MYPGAPPLDINVVKQSFTVSADWSLQEKAHGNLVALQNVELQNVELQNVDLTKRRPFKTPNLHNIDLTKRRMVFAHK